MKPSRNKRKIYWNRIAEHAPEERHTWYFLVINEPKMIGRIRQRIFKQLQPVDELITYRDETIRGEDLRVNCFSLESPKHELNFQGAYRGKWVKDDALHIRPGLEGYIDLMLEREFS